MAVPFVPPLQLGFDPETETIKPEGFVKETLPEAVQLFPSVTVAE